MGDYPLKIAKDYRVPEHQRVNAEKKKRQKLLLQESFHAIKTVCLTHTRKMKKKKKEYLYKKQTYKKDKQNKNKIKFNFYYLNPKSEPEGLLEGSLHPLPSGMRYRLLKKSKRNNRKAKDMLSFISLI